MTDRQVGNETVAAETLSYLADHRVLTLATSGPLGLWAAAVFYVNRDFELYFLSAGHTRHAQNMAAQPRVAGAIQEDYRDWPAIKGIQLEGHVRQIAGDEQAAAVALYRQKYPFVGRPGGLGDEVQRALLKVNWYCLEPDRLFYIDNSRGLGHRDEINLSTTPS